MSGQFNAHQPRRPTAATDRAIRTLRPGGRRLRHLCAVLSLGAVGVVSAVAPPAVAERAGARPGMGRVLAGRLDAGNNHTCIVSDGGLVRCWGSGQRGQLGYANISDIGDNEPPSRAGPVNVGPGRTATAVAAGAEHSCALLDSGTVRCWGAGTSGRLGYGNVTDVGDDETPGSAGPVDFGAGRTTIAITAGVGHTCAVLDDGTVRCWGDNANGRHGYPNTATIGDNETPRWAGPVIVGLISVAPGAPTGATATAIGPGHVAVSWIAPSDPGSAPLTGYRVSWKPPSSPKWLSGTTAQTTAYVSGLEEGTYEFVIVAINPARTGPPVTTGPVTVSDTPIDPPM